MYTNLKFKEGTLLPHPRRAESNVDAEISIHASYSMCNSMPPGPHLLSVVWSDTLPVMALLSSSFKYILKSDSLMKSWSKPNATRALEMRDSTVVSASTTQRPRVPTPGTVMKISKLSAPLATRGARGAGDRAAPAKADARVVWTTHRAAATRRAARRVKRWAAAMLCALPSLRIQT